MIAERGARSRGIAIAVGLLSAASLSYEILLTRVLAITQWHHLAHAVISLALLGFGASGTLLTLGRRLHERRFALTFAGSVGSFALTTLGGFWLSQHLSLNPFLLLWDPGEWGRLAIFYLILSIPFFFAGTAIGLALVHFRTAIAAIYAADLIGASVGALGTIGLLSLVTPVTAIGIVSSMGWIALLAVILAHRRWKFIWIPGLGLLTATIFTPYLTLNISPYKELSTALALPEVRVLDSRSSPLGWLHLLDSPAFHHAPGLSLTYPGSLPRQRGIFVDAGGMSPIIQFEGSWPDYLDHLTSALPYALLASPCVLVLGAGGGSDVLSALAHGARRVDAVEIHRPIVEWVRADPEFSGGIYDSNRYPVHVFVDEARGFLQSHRDRYELIQLTLLDSVSAASAGVYALTESYLYTREAMALALQRLNPGGILAITRWAKRPPRDALRLFATAAEVCGEEAKNRLALIRSWRTTTLLVKQGTWTSEETARIRAFCESRGFDLAYLPDLERDEVNRYHQLEEPIYYEACQQLLSPRRERFLEDYPFQIRPATDDRPYFFHFFRWKAFDMLRERGGAAWFPVEEWGYLLLIATLVQAILLSILLILMPLFALPAGERGIQIPLYFAALGFGFMFLEIASIQHFILFLSHPTYAVSVVLCGFLLFSGIGSALVSRVGRGRSGGVFLVIVAVGLIEAFLVGPLFRQWIGLDRGWKIGISFLLIAPLALGMGMPFPLGLRRVSEVRPRAVPWAWGINGCASVIGAVLATFIAMSLGFRVVTLVALGCYLVAGGLYLRGL